MAKELPPPSANRFGAISPTTSEAVNEELGDYLDLNDMVLDGGQCLVGIESTIVNCIETNPSIIRLGAITKEMIEVTIKNRLILPKINNTVRSPGTLHAHYSPKAKVILNEYAKEGEGFIALSSIPTPDGALRLASPNNVKEFSKQLYEALRAGDKSNLSIIKVIPAEGPGLAESIKDRLHKAAFQN